MEHLPHPIQWTIGPALPWTQDEADCVMRSRLRIDGRPAAPNAYGLVAFSFLIVALPSTPNGEEIPFARTSCVFNLN